jgi:phosphoglycolate phosphatase-like HAD superfamily hydrolase
LVSWVQWKISQEHTPWPFDCVRREIKIEEQVGNLSLDALVLFDVDGTLIRRAGAHHKRALEKAVLQVAGIHGTLSSFPTQGMLDGDLIRHLLAPVESSTADLNVLVHRAMSLAQEIYLADCPETLVHCVCPGVAELLINFTEAGIPMGLVTGNLSAIGTRKLALAGLDGYFRFGSYAEHGRTRSELVARALEFAEHSGWRTERTQVLLIGDHPNDIRAARANGIRVLATATGLSTREELERECPDLLVTDLTNLSVANVFENPERGYRKQLYEGGI